MLTPQRYQPRTRLIDDTQELHRLYVEEDLSIREIADNHSDHSKTRVYEALCEHGIIDTDSPSDTDSHSHDHATNGREEHDSASQSRDNRTSHGRDCHGQRGIDPPTLWFHPSF